MSFAKVPIGDNVPQTINVVVEIPRGSHHKYEYSEELDEIMLDRVLHSAVYYPTEYGFIPQTRSEDGDHLDVLVVVTDPLFPGCVVAVRPVGVLDMEDDKGQDWKIIAVCDTDPKLKTVNDINDLDEHVKNEISHFFAVYKNLENKQVTVKDWKGKEDAYKLIIQAQDKYQQEG